MPRAAPVLIEVVVGACRSLSRAFPSDFRDAFAHDIVATCRDVLTDAFRERGYPGLILAALWVTTDILRNVIAARLESGRSGDTLQDVAGSLMLVVVPVLVLIRVLTGPGVDGELIVSLAALVFHCALMCATALVCRRPTAGARGVLYLASASAIVLIAQNSSASFSVLERSSLIAVGGAARLSIPVLAVLALMSFAPGRSLHRSGSGDIESQRSG